MIWGTNKQPKKGLNIELSNLQYQYLYDLVMFAYEMDVPEQKGWDMQTYDNLVDNVCNAKETYLSENVSCLLYTSPSPRDDGVSRMPSSA